MSEREQLLESIANTIVDYRVEEIPRPSPRHVDRWIKQFSSEVQSPMLRELDHVLKRTYFPRASVEQHLSNMLNSEKLTGSTPYLFWQGIKFLNIQGGGNSQRFMLVMLDEILKRSYGFGIDDCGHDPQAYFYLDDILFSGNRIKNDLTAWINTEAPDEATVFVFTIAQHSGGYYYAANGIKKAAKAANKRITLQWWRVIEFEDRKAGVNDSDVLRPTELPDDEPTRAYVASLKYPQTMRTPPGLGRNAVFSSETGRHVLEQELLKAGVRIRSTSPYLNEYQRPLGNMVLETLGFGSLAVTFRNCPNNCPLAFWVGHPWYPLFPRKTN